MEPILSPWKKKWDTPPVQGQSHKVRYGSFAVPRLSLKEPTQSLSLLAPGCRDFGSQETRTLKSLPLPPVLEPSVLWAAARLSSPTQGGCQAR